MLTQFSIIFVQVTIHFSILKAFNFLSGESCESKKCYQELIFFISAKLCWPLFSSFGMFSTSNISAMVHPTNMVPRSFWIGFVSSFQWLHLILTVTTFSRIFLFIEILLSKVVYWHTKQKQKIFKLFPTLNFIFMLYVSYVPNK